MTNITLSPPLVGSKNTTEEPKVGTALKAVEQYLNQTVLGTGIGTENIIKESVTEEKLSAAVQTLLNKAAAGLTMTIQAGSLTGVSGIIYLMSTNATTLTLPPPTSGRQVGIICKNAIESVKLKAGGGVKIYGDFVNGSEEIVVRENQHVIVEADGTHWRILSGESAREQTYTVVSGITTVTAEAGVTPSTTRPAFVTLATISVAGKIMKAEYQVAGKVAAQIVAGEIPATSSRSMCAFEVLPGQAWKLAGAAEVSSITSATLLK